ncbi:50S ribosomal protein L10 [Bdellovibrio bacteriovorus]|nr:50S ribosomal protein L10 [Bdellovibrio bacteriovorus]
MITRADKEQEIKVITDKFSKAKGAFIVDFKGIKVEQVTSLRKKLNAADSEMKVVRNTLAKRAFKDHPAIDTAFANSMKGTNAIVFSYGEVNATAKALADFAKDVEILQIKTGVMDGEALDSNKIKFLATLPGKDQLRAQLLATFLASGSALARCLKAYGEKLGGGASTEAAPQA